MATKRGLVYTNMLMVKRHFLHSNFLFILCFLTFSSNALPIYCGGFKKAGAEETVFSAPHQTTHFQSVKALREVIRPYVSKAYGRLKVKLAKKKIPANTASQKQRFLTLLKEETGGKLFHYFDCPEGFELKDGT